MERCEDVLYSESSTVGGQPLLMPHDILQATTQLDDMLQKLEAAILDTVTDVNNKKKVRSLNVTMYLKMAYSFGSYSWVCVNGKDILQAQ